MRRSSIHLLWLVAIPLFAAVVGLAILDARVRQKLQVLNDQAQEIQARGERVRALVGAYRLGSPELIISRYAQVVNSSLRDRFGADVPPLEPRLSGLTPRKPTRAAALQNVSKDKTDKLVASLQTADDFRVRVQAALQLATSGSKRAGVALAAALNDTNASVRGAAAYGLGYIGDPDAIQALTDHSNDESFAVRQYVETSLVELRDDPERRPPKVFVRITEVSADDADIGTRFRLTLESNLNDLPGVATFVPPGKPSAPIVLVRARVTDYRMAEPDNTLHAAVELTVLTGDGVVAAKVTGKATAQSEPTDDQMQLKNEVLDAAIASATRRMPTALLAAARL